MGMAGFIIRGGIVAMPVRSGLRREMFQKRGVCNFVAAHLFNQIFYCN